MTSPVLVTGGTGTLGRHVVPLLQAAGHPVRVLSRHRHDPAPGLTHVTGDLTTGAGIDAAVDGVPTVLHLAGASKGDDATTRILVQAATRAGVRHLVYISVTAPDRIPFTYYRSKYAAEQVITASDLPWTTLRAAQFHDLALTVIGALAKSPVMPVPSGMRLQPVDARDVAARLVELAQGEPAGLVPDLVGPTVYSLHDLARSYLQARGARRLLLPVHVPGRIGRVYRAGENLSLDGVTVGERTWEAFLAERVGGPGRAAG